MSAVLEVVRPPERGDGPALDRRNRRTALVLIGWIALLALVSVVVVWVRN